VEATPQRSPETSCNLFRLVQTASIRTLLQIVYMGKKRSLTK